MKYRCYNFMCFYEKEWCMKYSAITEKKRKECELRKAFNRINNKSKNKYLTNCVEVGRKFLEEKEKAK